MAFHDPLIGALVGGRYRIESVIGSGGMAVVYGGKHEELGRQVALKVVSVELANNLGVIERFMREARTVAQIGHPNIVDVYDLGRLDDERPYLVMEQLSGKSFATLLKDEGLMSPRRVAELLDGVANALELVHAKGIIHRDIKLENLMLCRREDGSQVVKVLDFGIAAMKKPGLTTAAPTHHGNLTGTPAYLAPEAVFEERFDHRADVYALSVVAYVMLTGRLPHTGPDVVTLLRKKVGFEAPPLSTPERAYPLELEAVLAKGLERQPADRYSSARAMVDELAKAAGSYEVQEPTAQLAALVDEAHAPTVAPPRAPSVHEQRQASRAPWIGAVLGVLTVGLVLLGMRMLGPDRVTITAMSTPAPPPPAPPPLREVEEVDTPIDPEEPEPPVAQAPIVAPPVIERVSTPPPPPPRTLPPPPPPPAANPRLPRVADTGPDVSLPEVNRLRAETFTREGTNNLLKGYLPEAIRAFRDALMAAPRYAPAWRGLGLANERMGRKAEAIEAFEQYLRWSPAGAESSAVRERLDKLKRG